jgi:hypothetical protein
MPLEGESNKRKAGGRWPLRAGGAAELHSYPEGLASVLAFACGLSIDRILREECLDILPHSEEHPCGGGNPFGIENSTRLTPVVALR